MHRFPLAVLSGCLWLTCSSSTAQDPGWIVTAHYRTGVADGRLLLHHPTGAVPSIEVTGLPPELTGFPGTPLSSLGQNGASSVVVLEDGTIVVGQMSGLGNTLHLFHLDLQVSGGTATATVLAMIPLGAGTSGRRAHVAEMEVIGPTELVVGVSSLQTNGVSSALGGPGPLDGHWVGRVDVATQSVTPVPITNAGSLFAYFTRTLDAITSNGVDVWIGLNTQVLHLPLAGGSATPLVTMGRACWSLAVNRQGNLLASQFNQNWTITPSGTVLSMCNPGSAALVIEPATQDHVIINLGLIQRTTGCAAPVTIASPPASGWGNPSGIAVFPSPRVYGAPSPSGGPGYRWQVAPTAGGLPTVGNASFALGVQPQSGPMSFGAWVASLASANVPLPQFGVTALVNLAPGWVLATNLVPQPSGTVPFPIPPNAGLRGLPIYMQSVHLNGTLATSDGVHFRIL